MRDRADRTTILSNLVVAKTFVFIILLAHVSPWYVGLGGCLLVSAVCLLVLRRIDRFRRETHARSLAAEEALQKSEARFHAFMTNSPTLAWITDAEGRVEYVSEPYCRSTGRNAKDMIGKNVTEVVPEEFARVYLENIQTVARTGEPLETIEPAPDAQGEERYFLVHKFPLDFSGRTLVGGTATEITQQKRAEAALKESEERFRNAIQAMQEGLVLHDLEQGILICNESAERILGLTHDQMLGRVPTDPNWQSVHEDGTPWPPETCPALVTLRDGTPRQGVLMGIRKPNDVWTWVSISTMPLFREGEPRPYASVMTIADITAQRQAQEAIRENQRFIQGIAEASPSILYLYDLAAGRSIYTNREIAAVLGYTQEEILQTGAGLVRMLVHPEDLPRVLDHLERFAEAVDGVHYEIEYRMRHKNGEWRWICSRDTVFTRSEGVPCQIVGSAQDITQRHWYEEQIAQQMAQVHDANIQMQLQQMELSAANARLEDLATTDGLTGIKNHRAFQEKVREEFDRARRYGTSLSVALLDVDHFKDYNDSFGHPEGDQVLKQVAEVLEATARATDFVARYGGEEFVLILPETDAQYAIEAAERVRCAVAESTLERFGITISVGVSSLNLTTPDAAAMIKEADVALYASKNEGRNRSTHYDTILPAPE